MQIKLKRKRNKSLIYTYGNSLIFSMGILFAISSFTTPTLGIALIVIILTGSLL